MINMVGSGLRRRIEVILIRKLVLLILILQVIIVSRLAVVLRNRVPNLSLVELSQPHLILLAIFIDSLPWIL